MIFSREIAGLLTVNKTEERFRHTEIGLIRKLLNIVHLILELQYTLEDSANKTYHCAWKSQYFSEKLPKILGCEDVF